MGVINNNAEKPGGISASLPKAELEGRQPGFIKDIYTISRPELILIGDSFLKFTVTSSAPDIVVQMNYELRKESGVYAYGQEKIPVSAAIAAARTTQSVLSTLEPGILSKVRVSIVSGTSFRGQTYISVELQKGNTPLPQAAEILIGNYVTTNGALSFPGSPIIDPAEGVGYRIAQNADTLNVYTCPANTLTRVEGAFFAGVTNGASTQRVQLAYSTGPIFPAEANQPINTTYNYNFVSRNYPHVIPAGTPITVFEELTPVYMRPGDTLTAGAVVLTGAPTLGQLSLYGMEWIIP